MSLRTSVILSLACSLLLPELFLDFFKIFFFLAWWLTTFPVCLDPDFSCGLLRPRIRQNNGWVVEYGPKILEGFGEPWHGELLVMFSSVTLNVV